MRFIIGYQFIVNPKSNQPVGPKIITSFQPKNPTRDAGPLKGGQQYEIYYIRLTKVQEEDVLEYQFKGKGGIVKMFFTSVKQADQFICTASGQEYKELSV